MKKEKGKVFDIIFIAAALGTFGVAKAADSGSPQQSAAADCSAIASQTSDDPAVKEILGQSRLLCAKKQLADIQGQVDSLKTQRIITALTAIGEIPGMTGVISQPDKADHLGELLAQRTLYASALQVRTQLGNSIQKSGEGDTYVLLTDPEASKNRFLVVSSIAALKRMGAAMENLRDQVGNTALTAPKPPASIVPQYKLMAVPPIIAALPALISAAEGIAGILKTESTLSALSVTPKAEVIFAGLTNTSDTNLVLPAYRVSLDEDTNVFLQAYKDVFATYLALKPVPGQMQTKIDGLKKGQHASAQYLELKQRIEDQLAQFESLNKSYTDVPAEKNTSRFDDLVVAASTVDATAAGTLMVTASHFGGNGGVIKSKWSDDHLIYNNSVLLTYLLVSSKGIVLRAGTASCGTSFATPVKELGDNLSKVLSSTPACN